ncbi:MAG: exo-beta-N-acetylmuramidase NamZ family protein [Weeksellaceae bacterium]
MIQNSFKYTFLVVLYTFFSSCQAQQPREKSTSPNKIEIDGTVYNQQDINSEDTHIAKEIILGAEQSELYLPQLKDKNVGVITNQTGIIPANHSQHLVDYLLDQKIKVKRIFAPEHGFRGEADAGETVKDGIDTQTGLPIISLYGKNKKPYDSQISDLDVLVFDIQDVGVRFYTYISTLHYVMEAAAENNIPVIVLDRPNPNAHYIDGPILEASQKTFVGMHPVPIVYGMTIGEYAQMINGEKWLKNRVTCDLTIVPLKNYTHDTVYDLPVKPSPNLPNAQSINLYPSLCFFEGTNVSEGRGTEMQFQIYGSPYLKDMAFKFTPKPNKGAKNPQHNGKLCYGEDLRNYPRLSEIKLNWLIKAYKNNTQQPFFTKNAGAFWLDKLAGTDDLRKQIENGWSEEKIKATWKDGLEKFKNIRGKYLLYP